MRVEMVRGEVEGGARVHDYVNVHDLQPIREGKGMEMT